MKLKLSSKKKIVLVRKVNINSKTGQPSITLPKKAMKKIPKKVKIVW